MNSKIVVYVDLDDPLCDYTSLFNQGLLGNPKIKYSQSLTGFFLNLELIPNAIDAFKWLDNRDEFDVYILSAPSIHNPHCYTEKRLWVEKGRMIFKEK
jgi:5'-nucleotidase